MRTSTKNAFGWSLLLVLAACGLSGCAPRDAQGMCRGQGECDKDNACIVGRCRPRAEPLTLTESRRVVLEPQAIAVLSSRESQRVDASAIGFGRTSTGDVVMLLSFDEELASDMMVESAFLVLAPVEGAPSPFRAVPIQIASIREEWSQSQVSWGRQPALSLPETVADATAHSRDSLRIDVTRLIASSSERHGIAILASGRDPIGAFYSTGLGEGAAPRLELYLRSAKAPVPSASVSPPLAPSKSTAPLPSASSAAEHGDEDDDDGPIQLKPAKKNPTPPKRPKKIPFSR